MSKRRKDKVWSLASLDHYLLPEGDFPVQKHTFNVVFKGHSGTGFALLTS